MSDTTPPKNFNQQVGENLRTLRGISRLSQTELADAMSSRGYSWQQQTVLKIEKGIRPLKFEEADALTVVFGCGLEDVRAHNPEESTFWQLSKVEQEIRALERRREEIDEELLAAQERAQELQQQIMEAMHVQR